MPDDKKINIKAVALGSVKEFEIDANTRLGDFLEKNPHYRNVESIKLNGFKAELEIDYQFKDGDIIFLVSSIIGHAPVMETIDDGIDLVRSFLRCAKSLIVVDPYILSGQRDGMDSAELLLGVFDWPTLDSVHFILDNRKIHTKVHEEIDATSREHSTEFSISHTTKIHDRVWIRDRARALNPGTSLNGIGRRIAFAHELSNQDLSRFLEILTEQSLLLENT